MNETKAARYQRFQRRTGVAGALVGFVLIAVLVATPGARWLADASRDLTAGLPGAVRFLAALATFVTAVVLLWECVALPVVLYRAVSLRRRFHRSGGAPDRTLAAQIQATLIGLAGALAAALATELSVALAGRWWWLTNGALLTLFLAGALRLTPVVFVRLGGTRPIARPDLARRLAELARRAGVPIAGLHEWRADDGEAGAMVAGLGGARRIFVASEMLRDWSDDEVAVVVAHELAHHAHRDLRRALALDAAVLVLGCGAADAAFAMAASPAGLTSLADLAALPFLALVTGAVWLVATPVRHVLSRRQERRADAFALSLTGGAEAFGAAVRRLGASRLAEDRPSRLAHWLFSRHPSVAERLALAKAFARERDGAAGL